VVPIPVTTYLKCRRTTRFRASRHLSLDFSTITFAGSTLLLLIFYTATQYHDFQSRICGFVTMRQRDCSSDVSVVYDAMECIFPLPAEQWQLSH
jgi:hypothetical protein